MGNIQDLQKHYNKKCQELFDIAESNYKGIWKFGVCMNHSVWGHIQLLIEYDQNNPCYGIYFGCKMNDKQDKNDKLEELKNDIWKSYKDKIYPETSVEMDNVFLPDCEKDCQKKEGMFWFFWIRLDEHLDMEDAMQRLNILIEIFKGRGFIMKTDFKHAENEE